MGIPDVMINLRGQKKVEDYLLNLKAGNLRESDKYGMIYEIIRILEGISWEALNRLDFNQALKEIVRLRYSDKGKMFPIDGELEYVKRLHNKNTRVFELRINFNFPETTDIVTSGVFKKETWFCRILFFYYVDYRSDEGNEFFFLTEFLEKNPKDLNSNLQTIVRQANHFTNALSVQVGQVKDNMRKKESLHYKYFISKYP